MYKWNSKCNSFELYEPEYETVIEKESTSTLYSQEQVDSIFANRGSYQVIKDVDGVPTIVDLYTENEIAITNKKKRINELKALLQATDYQAIKYAEGLITEADYAPIKTQRQAWRDEINRLESPAN